MIEEAVLLEHDFYQFLVRLNIGFIHPVPEKVKVRLAIGPVSKVQRLVKYPILLFATPANEVHSLSCLQNLCDLIRQKGGNGRLHNVMLVCPELGVRHIGVHGDEELLIRVVQIPLNHPGFDHRQKRCRGFFEEFEDELFDALRAVEGIAVDGGAERTSFKTFDGIDDDGEPFHAFEGFLDPEVEFAQVEEVGRVFFCETYLLVFKKSN